VPVYPRAEGGGPDTAEQFLSEETVELGRGRRFARGGLARGLIGKSAQRRQRRKN